MHATATRQQQQQHGRSGGRGSNKYSPKPRLAARGRPAQKHVQPRLVARARPTQSTCTAQASSQKRPPVNVCRLDAGVQHLRLGWQRARPHVGCTHIHDLGEGCIVDGGHGYSNVVGSVHVEGWEKGEGAWRREAGALGDGARARRAASPWAGTGAALQPPAPTPNAPSSALCGPNHPPPPPRPLPYG